MEKLKTLRNFIILFVGVIFIFSLSSCASTKAVTAPRMKDLSVLEIGTHRHIVLAELETPVHTEVKDGRTIDIFRFIQGQHTALKAFKAVGYGVLAVGSFGVSELVTNPVEGTVGKGSELQFRVIYDADEKVEQIHVLKDERWIRVQELADTDTPS